MEGRITGKVTVRSVRQRDEPRFCAASSIETSTAFSAATVGSST
jgi:hypothetical protein